MKVALHPNMKNVLKSITCYRSVISTALFCTLLDGYILVKKHFSSIDELFVLMMTDGICMLDIVFHTQTQCPGNMLTPHAVSRAEDKMF